MIYPILAYGAPVLRRRASAIEKDFTGLQQLIEDMWETMYASNGVGLAAPQINKSIRLFVVDSEQIFKNAEPDEESYIDAPGVKMAFVNAEIIEVKGKPWIYNEGCLSIPKIREDVLRNESVTLKYDDENFVSHTRSFHGITARIILHEYDHIEGKLFIDYLSPMKRKLLKGKLDDISNGKIKVDYKMSFAK